MGKNTKKPEYFGRQQSTEPQYSLLTGRGDGDSLDFGKNNPLSGWEKSSQDGGCRWFDDGPMIRADIPFLLKHFGLTDVVDDRLADFEALRYMSPAELIRIRRKHEARKGIAKLHVFSDRAGGHIPAEMVCCRQHALA